MTDLSAISGLGELGLLKVLAPFITQFNEHWPLGVGDDGAILRVPGDVIVTMDLLFDGVHFSDQTTPAHSVGWRAACANLSDLAAMGATGVGLIVGLGLPATTPLAWVEALYQGIQDCAGTVPIVGGDTCRSKTRTVAITALGQVTPGRAFLRSQAHVGDLLVITGPVGGAQAGLTLLLNPEYYPEAPIQTRQQLIQRHQYPRPRLDWVGPLQKLTGPVGAMDTSDGLADALIQMAQASGVGMILDCSQIPLAAINLDPEQALAWALWGGEDFELLLSVPPSQLDLIQALDPTVIGQVVAQNPGHVWTTTGEAITRQQAFAHF